MLCTPSSPGFRILDGSLADFISYRRHHDADRKISRIFISNNKDVIDSGSRFSNCPSFIFGNRMYGLAQPTHRILEDIHRIQFRSGFLCSSSSWQPIQ